MLQGRSSSLISLLIPDVEKFYFFKRFRDISVKMFSLSLERNNMPLSCDNHSEDFIITFGLLLQYIQSANNVPNLLSKPIEKIS